ncbi:MAG: M48 family metalloprotease [Planctomycetes bacterium]|nr:M48 family metalloprotease [Planctomycetota bacterium]
MGYLLNIVLAVAVLGLADLGWESPREWPWMLFVLACAPVLLGRALHALVLRGRFPAADLLARLLAISPPVCFALLVGECGWCASVERWFGGSASFLEWPRWTLVPVIAPFVFFQALAIDARARALWTPATGGRWRAFQLRMFSSALLPIAVYVAASIGIGCFPELRTRIEVVALYNVLFAGAMLVVLALFLPFLLRNTWETEPIPAGTQRSVLESVARAAGFRARELLVWRTGGTMANAAIVGLGKHTRVVLFSDLLLAQLDPRELAAVFAHEMGHAVRRHVFVFVALAGGFFLSLDALANALLDVNEWLAGGFVLAALAGGYFAFGWLSRRFELEADLYSLALLRDPQALIDALEKVGGSFRDVASWRHFSTSRRVEFLVRTTHDARVGTRLLKLLRIVSVAAVAWFVIALGAQLWTVSRAAPVELVQAELCLGRYERAVERAAEVAELPEDLARLVQRARGLTSGDDDLARLERSARAALRAGDEVAAHEWLTLGALRHRRDLAIVAEAVREWHVDHATDVRAVLGEELWTAWSADLEALRAR